MLTNNVGVISHYPPPKYHTQDIADQQIAKANGNAVYQLPLPTLHTNETQRGYRNRKMLVSTKSAPVILALQVVEYQP